MAKLASIVTSGTEKNMQPLRAQARPARAIAVGGATAQSRAKQNTRAALAVLAAAGFIAAYIVPASVALADAPEPAQSASTAWATTVDGAQSLLVADDAAGATLSRGTYETYVAPKPEPTPEPTAETTSSSSSEYYEAPMYSGGGTAQDWMTAAGIAQSDWGYVDYIVTHESGWNPNATNPSSGACGLVQALPCSKVPGGGYDPVANLTWANGYAVSRYGSWSGAYSFWISNSWW